MKNNLYKYLTEHGDMQRAIGYAKELTRLSEATPEDKLAYSQMHRVFELIGMQTKMTQKSKKPNRNNEIGGKSLVFIADEGISDSKSVSKAIGLKPSRTRDYLKQLVDEGILETEGAYKNRKYKIKVQGYVCHRP